MKFRPPTLDTIVWIAISIAGILLIGLVVWFFRSPSITIQNNPRNNEPISPLTGLPCDEPLRRPIAVMIASDPVARPLSGLEAADIVFEMPVTPNGITRMMAVYQCGTEPKEIGSVRSARQDFIPLAQGLKAIYAHWGGEYEALEELRSGIMDNIDALVHTPTTFFRKKNIPAPHNGFTRISLLREQATKMGYVASASIQAYPHESGTPALNLGSVVDRVTIPWLPSMTVEYRYDPNTNTYGRWRGGTPEKDATSGNQIQASVVIVMDTDWSFLRDQYISVRTTGQGSAIIYQNGRSILATWKKANREDMLMFVDANGKAIPLATGRIWVEINPPLSAIR